MIQQINGKWYVLSAGVLYRRDYGPAKGHTAKRRPDGAWVISWNGEERKTLPGNTDLEQVAKEMDGLDKELRAWIRL